MYSNPRPKVMKSVSARGKPKRTPAPVVVLMYGATPLRFDVSSCAGRRQTPRSPRPRVKYGLVNDSEATGVDPAVVHLQGTARYRMPKMLFCETDADRMILSALEKPAPKSTLPVGLLDTLMLTSTWSVVPVHRTASRR